MNFNSRVNAQGGLNLAGVWPAATGFAPAGQIVTVAVGDYAVTFNALDKNGKGKSSGATFKLTGKPPLLNFTLSAKSANLPGPLAELGFVNATIKKSVLTCPVLMTIGSDTNLAAPTVIYTAKKGKSGTAKK